MQIKKFNCLADDAMLIRKIVFIDEQGFRDEFDEIDKTATHLVAYDNERPVATCRFFHGDEENCYIIGRLAVIKEYRGKRMGAFMLSEAEKLIKDSGAKQIKLHAQAQATEFYTKQGYKICSKMEYEEFCEHYWMKKEL